MPESENRLAPIAVFAYDRRDHFEKMFAALRVCQGFGESEVYLFLDGPKGEQDRARVEAVRSFARSIALPNVRLVERTKNMGLRASIYDGVGSLCRSHGRVIVLEDDLVLSPCALEYFNRALQHYENEARVWAVVGYQYDVPSLRSVNRALVLPFPHPWGWATWARAWETFDLEAEVHSSDMASAAFRRFFDVNGLRDFTDMLGLALAGRINSWYIRWYYKVFTERGVCIYPPVSYVRNIGMGAGGTHASALNPYRFLVRGGPLAQEVVQMPPSVRVDYFAVDAIARSWEARVQKAISFAGRVKRCVRPFWARMRGWA